MAEYDIIHIDDELRWRDSLSEAAERAMWSYRGMGSYREFSNAINGRDRATVYVLDGQFFIKPDNEHVEFLADAATDTIRRVHSDAKILWWTASPKDQSKAKEQSVVFRYKGYCDVRELMKFIQKMRALS